jgi:hypothetical protein
MAWQVGMQAATRQWINFEETLKWMAAAQTFEES